MFSMLTFAQNEPRSDYERNYEPVCYLLLYEVSPFQFSHCAYQEPGEYILVLCPPFYSQYSNEDWRKLVRSYWCQHGEFPEGVKIRSFYPYTGPNISTLPNI
ncbi:hypothetical protein [Myroides odoratus]|uniref:hypothetical protein n=1 Tax=Myroides odoratus TaxID=256 RepID=UPI003342E1A5